MKKCLLIPVISLCLYSCSKPYKVTAVDYLKTKIGPASYVDTVKFSKPESIYSAYYDTPEYLHLKNAHDSLEVVGEQDKADTLAAIIKNSVKGFKPQIEAWGVDLIYKAKDKKGVLKTDTCRFLFDGKLKKINGLRGTSIPIPVDI